VYLSCGAQYASEQCVVVNYDAEQYSIQPAIDTLVLDSMRCFNHASANVLNTYQCYLKVRRNKRHHHHDHICLWRQQDDTAQYKSKVYS